jgi:hypothetical protein
VNTAIRSYSSRVRVGIAVALALAADASAGSEASDGYFHRLAADIHARLDAMHATHAPQLVPPVRVDVKWKPQKLAPALDFGAPLVALAAADLDGDGRSELYAVTTTHVIAIAYVDHRLKELGRVAFVGDRAVPAPRDPVGSAVIDGKTVVASASSFARSLRAGWKGKTFTGDAGEPGFELCPGERAQLAHGRNYFGDPQAAYYGARCRGDLVEADGHPLRLRAVLGATGKLDVAVERCAAGGTECQHASDFSYAKVGTAFELADLDRDGKPELVFSGAGAPGEPDEVRVVTLGDDERKTKLKKAFIAEGVAAIAVADIDGDGKPEVIAAVRLAGSTRIDFWRMN